MNVWKEKDNALLLSVYYQESNHKTFLKDMAKHFKTTQPDVEQQIRYLVTLDEEKDEIIDDYA